MVKPEVVAYLQANLDKHPVDDLRQQLASEGISAPDFEDSLKSALLAPQTAADPSPRSTPSRASLIFLIIGAVLVAAAALIVSRMQSPSPPSSAPSSQLASSGGEAAFVGQTGYVIRLPKSYEAVDSFKDPQRSQEVVHFCRIGTDPTNFLNEGLFGQLGIVRLEVQPNPVAGSIAGIDRLSQLIAAQHQSRGDKFSIKNIQVSSLSGIQLAVELPQPYIESYILGEKVLYHFYAGLDDAVYRDILNSLRDPHAETL